MYLIHCCSLFLVDYLFFSSKIRPKFKLKNGTKPATIDRGGYKLSEARSCLVVGCGWFNMCFNPSSNPVI
ncbi:hypothetical protein HanXRQr2_Chr07g0312561 [Helianthus annuus]|uniref:Uncharacterized protein n=1 Tax=Helianthus annuus TaxID=4232 RepID=A0A251UE21_HELAN|nr:hypothetical protein HanXRQr2_Chr07g0312561 [Helianthus annuus]KAJ0906168.1 hypothetical protein HanPSC8_Chr07g0302411 [Helianthus annuus]